MKSKRIITTVALSVLLFAGSAAAQTSSDPVIAGAPNTGSGGSARANILLLTGSAAVALSGLATLLRRRTL